MVPWCRNKKYLPFDFVLQQNCIIIELDGPHHFKQVSNWQSPVLAHETDIYKMNCANKNGFSIIRIVQNDVWKDKYDWLKVLKEYIQKIIEENKTQNICIC